MYVYSRTCCYVSETGYRCEISQNSTINLPCDRRSSTCHILVQRVSSGFPLPPAFWSLCVLDIHLKQLQAWFCGTSIWPLSIHRICTRKFICQKWLTHCDDRDSYDPITFYTILVITVNISYKAIPYHSIVTILLFVGKMGCYRTTSVF